MGMLVPSAYSKSILTLSYYKAKEVYPVINDFLIPIKRQTGLSLYTHIHMTENCFYNLPLQITPASS